MYLDRVLYYFSIGPHILLHLARPMYHVHVSSGSSIILYSGHHFQINILVFLRIKKSHLGHSQHYYYPSFLLHHLHNYLYPLNTRTQPCHTLYDYPSFTQFHRPSSIFLHNHHTYCHSFTSIVLLRNQVHINSYYTHTYFYFSLNQLYLIHVQFIFELLHLYTMLIVLQLV